MRPGAHPRHRPLPLRLRPRSLDEFVGQEHVLGPGSALASRSRRTASARRSSTAAGKRQDDPGPDRRRTRPGAAFEELSAVSATVAQVRAVIAGARERLGAQGQRTILFLDEIHRFNKAQQDALLPAVEEGVITLIGATTENPYFEVNSALLSRAQLYELEPHSPEGLEQIARRGADELGVELRPEVVALVAEQAGDARNALSILELAAQTARAENVGLEPASRTRRRSAARVRQGRRPPLRHDLRVHQVDPRIGSGRRRLLPGRDARGRRGPALHRASHDRARVRGRRQRRPAGARRRCCGRARAEHVGLPEARLNLSQAAIYLARAPKSNARYVAIKEATRDVQERGGLRPPKSLRDASYAGAKKLGHGRATSIRTRTSASSTWTTSPTS